MREIGIDIIIDEVEKLCMNANYYLNDDIKDALIYASNSERSDTGRGIIKLLLENAQLAAEQKMAMCQDTGMVVVFCEVGQEVSIVGGGITTAINEGIRRGYKKAYLRNSVVADPINRVNTNDNTPAVIHYDIVQGDHIKISLAPKGFGSENMSALAMLKPSDGIEGVKKFVIDVVDKAGPNPCPPIVVGVGIGGTMEKAALLAKKALFRSIDKPSNIEYVSELEAELLEKINKLGTGPAGLGGSTTALGINIEVYPTHIAGLPVAVNINCHATRHAEVII